LPDRSNKLLILAGGQGTRIRPVSGDLPKCLVPIGGAPFLHFKLCQAITWGVTHITLALGYKGRMVEKYVRENQKAAPWQNLKFSFVFDGPIPMGTGGAIRNALISNQDANTLVTYGDNLLSVKEDDVQYISEQTEQDLVLTINHKSHNGVRGNVKKITEHTAIYTSQETATHVDYGLFFINSRVAKYMPTTAFDFGSWLKEYSQTKPFGCREIYSRYYEINDPSTFEQTRKFVETKRDLL